VTVTLHNGDCREVLATLAAGSVQTCVTSPPYFGLRDYGVAGQIGLEQTVESYVAELVAVFRAVRRVLRDDGTLWLNLGDSYAGSWTGNSLRPEGGSQRAGKPGFQPLDQRYAPRSGYTPDGLKTKDLIGIPWRVAFALQADGWYLRSDIIWHKPNPMPESVTDRPTKSHEYIFLLSKQERYYYDADAIAEPVTQTTVARVSQPNLDQQRGSDRVPGKTNGPMKAVVKKQDALGKATYTGFNDRYFSKDSKPTRNKRTVWTVTTKPFKGAHFATFPPDLIEPCIKAGSRPGDTVIDPFGGAGTTGLVADRLGRDAVLIELNPEYAEMARQRIKQDAPLLTAAD
jgi:DNA modification methylase